MGFVGTVFANWLTRKNKTSYKYYYKRYVHKGYSLHNTILGILEAFVDNENIYGVCQAHDGRDIVADTLCFRNPASFYDFSDWGCMRVRVGYERDSENCFIMCQKKHQLDLFVDKFCKKAFDPKTELTFLGTG